MASLKAKTKNQTHNYLEKRDISETNNEIKHVWKTGDRYYKLAATYYGRPELWWAIALYNEKPTEAHINFGNTIRVPVPIETYLRYL